MADPRGFKPINQLWQSATVDQDSERLYEEIQGLSGSQDTEPTGTVVGGTRAGEEEEEEEEEENARGRRRLDFGAQVGASGDWWSREGREEFGTASGGTVRRTPERRNVATGTRSRSRSADRPLASARQDIGRVEEEQYAPRRSHVEPSTGAVLPPPATSLKLTRGRPSSTIARYLHSASTNVGHYHHHHHGLHPGQYPPPGSRTTARQHRHHHSSRGFSNETQEEVQEDDEATLRELLVRYVLTRGRDTFSVHLCTRKSTIISRV